LLFAHQNAWHHIMEDSFLDTNIAISLLITQAVFGLLVSSVACYKPEGRGFEPQLGNCYQFTSSFRKQ
jgi:hypothetical protein